MRKFGYQWPEIFDCEKMPESRDGMCVGENKNEEENSKMADGEDPAEHQIARKRELECPHTMKVLSKQRLIGNVKCINTNCKKQTHSMLVNTSAKSSKEKIFLNANEYM